MLIGIYKDKVFDVPEIKILKERFLAIKKNYDNNTKQRKIALQNMRAERDQLEVRDMGRESLQDSTTTSPSTPTSTTSSTKSNLEMNDNVKKIIKLLLTELKSVYNALIKSSTDIERIFRLPLYQLTDEKKVNFNFGDIHREEFSTALIQDEFIKVSHIVIIGNIISD